MTKPKQNLCTLATSVLSPQTRRPTAAMLAVWVLLATPTLADDPVVHFHPTAAEPEVPPRYQMQAHEFSCQVSPLPAKWFNSVKEFEVTFPSPVTTADACNNRVHCEYFLPRGDGPHAGVIVLHILGGDFELSRTIGRTLALNGVGALFVKMPYYGPRRPAGKRIRMISADLDQTVNGMTQAVLDIRRAVAWLAARDEIDDDRLGITGISLGGIVSALAAAIEPRLGSVCLILSGGDLETIIRESVETKDIRDIWSRRNFDVNLVRQKLRQVDPLTYGNRLKSRRVLMFNATQDRSIPRHCTERLWRAMGEPEIHWWEASHYSAIWFLPGTLIRVSHFFNTP